MTKTSQLIGIIFDIFKVFSIIACMISSVIIILWLFFGLMASVIDPRLLMIMKGSPLLPFVRFSMIVFLISTIILIFSIVYDWAAKIKPK